MIVLLKFQFGGLVLQFVHLVLHRVWCVLNTKDLGLVVESDEFRLDEFKLSFEILDK